MAELPVYKSQIQESTSSVAPALAGISASQKGEAMLGQSLQNKLGAFFETSKAIAEPIMASKAEAKALNQFRSGDESQIGITDAYGFNAYKSAYNKRVQQLALKESQNDIKRKYSDLEREYFDNPSLYKKLSTEFRDGYLDKLPEFAKAEAYVYSEALYTDSSKRVADNHLKKMRDIENASTNENLMNKFNDSTNSSYNGDFEMSMYMKSEYDKIVDQQVEDNIITYEQGRQKKEILNAKNRENNFVGIMDRLIDEDSLDDAVNYLNNFETSTFDEFDTQERDITASKMRANLNAAISKKKAQEKDEQDFSNQIVGTAIDIFKSGRIPDNMGTVYNALNRASKAKVYEFGLQSQAFKVSEKYANLSLPEQQKALNDYKSKKVISGTDLEVMNILDKNLKERIAKASSDPISLSVQEGRYKSTMPLEIENKDAWGYILGERARQSTQNQITYGEGSYQLMTETEATQFTDWLNSPMTSINDKVDFITTIEGSTPQKSVQVYKQLSKQGASIFAMAGSLVRENKVETAKQILKGQTILREFGNIEGIEEVKIKLFDEIGNAMAYANEGDRKMLTDSALALYMYKAEQNGDLEKGLTSKNTKSVITDLTNGISKRNGQSFFLPKGVEKDDFDDFIDELDENSFKDVGSISPSEAVKVVQSGQLVSIGTGGYRVKYKNGWLRTKDKKPFVLRYY